MVAQSERCPHCGTFDFEIEEDPQGFEAVVVHCINCERKETKREAERQQSGGMKGKTVAIRRRPSGPASPSPGR